MDFEQWPSEYINAHILANSPKRDPWTQLVIISHYIKIKPRNKDHFKENSIRILAKPNMTYFVKG